MAIEIKELVIKTTLENGTSSSNLSLSNDLKIEIEKQFTRQKSEIIEQCIQLISDGFKRQNER
jgi:hypothetical protein